MMPDGELVEVLVCLGVFPDLGEGVAQREGVDRCVGRKELIDVPGGVEAQDQEAVVGKDVEDALALGLRRIGASRDRSVKIAERVEPGLMGRFLVPDPDDRIIHRDVAHLVEVALVVIPVREGVSLFGQGIAQVMVAGDDDEAVGVFLDIRPQLGAELVEKDLGGRVLLGFALVAMSPETMTASSREQLSSWVRSSASWLAQLRASASVPKWRSEMWMMFMGLSLSSVRPRLPTRWSR